MRYAIPVLGDRVAPRSTCAEGVLILALNGGRIAHKEMTARAISNPVDLVSVLRDFQVDTLVCGGNNLETKELLSSFEVSVIDNVACSLAETVDALQHGTLQPGYGLLTTSSLDRTKAKVIAIRPNGVKGEIQNRKSSSPTTPIDCLACRERLCLKRERCHFSLPRKAAVSDEQHQMLESAADISCETERLLCRVAELVYFFLEMKYKRVGIAFCVELLDQTRVLAGVLRRFFEVFAACCKVSDSSVDQQEMGSELDTLGMESAPCNPLGQAEILHNFGSEINVLVGLCIGVDCVFTQASKVPVTTLFVKDRMLANNPIGAMYSDYYLAEIARHKADV